MRRAQYFIETVIIFTIFTLLGLLSLLNIKLDLVKFITKNSLWLDRSHTISNLGIAYALFFLILLIITFRVNLAKKYITNKVYHQLMIEFKSYFQQLYIFIKQFKNNLGLVSALILGVFTYSYFLSQTMRYDEASTYMEYCSKGIRYLFKYDRPNNHVFHSILVTIFTNLFGNSPSIIRLPAFIAGLSSIPLVFLICRKLNFRHSGYFACHLMAVFPFLVLFSTNARGYTLIMLFTLILILNSLYYISSKSKLSLIIISFISALGLFTIPIMLAPIAGIFIYVFLYQFLENKNILNIIVAYVIPYILLTATFTLIFYTPVIIENNGVEKIISNKWLVSQPWESFLNSLIPHFKGAVKHLFRDVPIWLRLLILGLIIVELIYAIKNKIQRNLLLLPSILFGTILILFINHRIPKTRFYIFILPILIIYADLGFSRIISKLPDYYKSIGISIIALYSIIFALNLIDNDSIKKYRDTGLVKEVPYVVSFLQKRVRENDKIFVKAPLYAQVLYYLTTSKGTPQALVRGPEKNSYILTDGDVIGINDRKLNKVNIKNKNNYYLLLAKYQTLNDFAVKNPKKIFEYGRITIYKESD